MDDVMDDFPANDRAIAAVSQVECVEGPGLGVWLLPLVLAGACMWIALIVMLVR
ncbi:hypothetical protein [Paragemmobacter straminiformis]|uniref:Uncharacterized protein n=1 Tax=Paragemmobacter straminiformis TaxID=2045119 RepID=A0A842I6S1_9RHOB|nr:hypothetical protein [Gemmobacter straminiformis]MBC2835103.1 hypothetical protein [Gemmobacter straminiformis]